MTRSDLQFGSIALAAAGSVDWRGSAGRRGSRRHCSGPGGMAPRRLLRALYAPAQYLSAPPSGESFLNPCPHPNTTIQQSSSYPSSSGTVSQLVWSHPAQGLACERLLAKYAKCIPEPQLHACSSCMSHRHAHRLTRILGTRAWRAGWEVWGQKVP